MCETEKIETPRYSRKWYLEAFYEDLDVLQKRMDLSRTEINYLIHLLKEAIHYEGEEAEEHV